MKNVEKSFLQLISIIEKLRKECPWDREQTFESLRPLTIEETYELTEAILKKDVAEIEEELGDLLMHIVFYAKIASEEKHFELTEVIDGICDKLIRRHPHVFDDLGLKNSEDVKRNWEKIKLNEKKKKNTSIFSGLPTTLPALIKSQRIQAKAKAVGFDWQKKEEVWDKVQEELSELKYELENGSEETKTKEFGDFIFAIINASRLYNVNAENALEKTNLEFIRRFEYIENRAMEKGLTVEKLAFDDMEKYWNEAKKLP